MEIGKEDVVAAIRKSAIGHSYKSEVRDMLSDIDSYAESVLNAVSTGSYPELLAYREFDTVNTNGKRRHIEQPSLFTRVLQHLSIVLLKPLYDALDPHVSFNCKEGYGICASDRSKSLSHFIKYNVYDRRDLHYALAVDQRRCYGHITRKLYRKSLKRLTSDSGLIDFAVNVTFHGDSFPIGTPTSPFAHHVIMLAFDRWLGSVPGPKARYADDTVLFFRTSEEAAEAKWRIMNFWWYVYGIRAKRNPLIIDLDMSPLSFCGLVFRRNRDRTATSHDKGYCRGGEACHVCRTVTRPAFAVRFVNCKFIISPWFQKVKAPLRGCLRPAAPFRCAVALRALLTPAGPGQNSRCGRGSRTGGCRQPGSGASSGRRTHCHGTGASAGNGFPTTL